ncbi:uncharacterized protein LOC114353071 [Ostrinia furnacalis]|uniref:uncharacterized protein LOC114353071 n=1 Tax=Ostrinia furnacalis TaxID=93504 RepID=UPI001038F7D5|nr:uncharacterized protein LOC114353071 [Ostrinia furnacalis]
MKMLPQQYCLRWKHHHSNVQNMFAQLLEKERFCDVTLYCSPSFATQVPNKDTVDPHHIRGVSLRAHRVVLAACSELLGALLGAHEAQGEPVLVIDGAEPRHLRALLDYMYTGEMNVHHSQLASLLKTAEELRIKGLTDIRWNNKDEPPDCETGVVTAVPTPLKPEAKQPAAEKQPSPKPKSPKHSPVKSPKQMEAEVKKETEDEVDIKPEKYTVNGGPPPLIKLPTKEKPSPPKREHSDSETPSPKRQRLASGTEHTDDESASHSLPDTGRERDPEWQHGNLDITAERVVGWGGGPESAGDWSREPSDDEWADAPTDIGSFLHTRLRVDGDNSADDESNDSAGGARSVSSVAASSSSVADRTDVKVEPFAITPQTNKPTVGPKSGPTDPRFTDVVKLTDYLQHGRRPQFWEEHYVKRVMEAVRMKELEMKQAAEILGVSYGTLYGRYRDVYGCINRPYRTARDFWQAKGPSEVLERLQRGEISVEAASLALGVSVNNLAAYMADFPQPHQEKGPSEVLERLQRGEISVEAASLALGVSVNNLAAYMADFPQTHQEKEPSEVLERLQRGEISVEAASLALGVSVNNLAAYMADFPQTHQEKGPSEVLERLQRGEISVEAASLALGVSVNNLAAYMADFPQTHQEKGQPYDKFQMKKLSRFIQVLLYMADFPQPHQEKGPSEVLERLQRGEISVEAASLALGVSVNNLAAYMADFPQTHQEKGAPFSQMTSQLDIDLPQVLVLALGVSVNNLAAYMADFPQTHQEEGPSEVLERLQRGEISVEAASLALGVSVNNLAAYMADFPQPHQEKGPSEVLERLQRGEISVEAASLALGVSVNNLAAYMADFPQPHQEKGQKEKDQHNPSGPSEVLERLQRGEISVEAASLALGVSVNNLAAYMADFPQTHQEKEFEPIPIEIDPSLKMRPRTYSAGSVAAKPPPRKLAPVPEKPFPAKPGSLDGALAAGDPFRKLAPASLTVAPAASDKQSKKILIGSLIDEDPIPATVITTSDSKVVTNVTTPTTAGSGKWPTIRVASLESLGGAASPSALMRTRPDLTIVAAKRPDQDNSESN